LPERVNKTQGFRCPGYNISRNGDKRVTCVLLLWT